MLAELRLVQLAGVACASGVKEMRIEHLFKSYIRLRNEWDTLVALPKFTAMAGSVQTAPSEIHGIGLFANEDLDDGALTSFYPVDALGHTSGYLTAGKANRAHFAGSEKLRMQTTGWYRAGLSHPTLLTWADDLWADANPTQTAEPGWLAHYANDVGKLRVCASDDDVCKYYATAKAHSNCVLIPFGDAAPLLCIVSTRCVPKGEELLLSYGHEYWMPRYVPPPSVREQAESALGPRSVRAQSILQERCRAEIQLLRDLVELDRKMLNRYMASTKTG